MWLKFGEQVKVSVVPSDRQVDCFKKMVLFANNLVDMSRGSDPTFRLRSRHFSAREYDSIAPYVAALDIARETMFPACMATDSSPGSIPNKKPPTQRIP